MSNTNESKIIISKAFDICIKNDRELKSVYVDENKYLRYLYFLTNEKIFSLNILTKAHEEFNFSRGHDVLYITGNVSHKYLIIIFKNCKIFAIDTSNKQIFYFKNLQNIPINLDEDAKENKFSPKLQLFANDDLSKVVLYAGEEIVIWYKYQVKYNIKKNIKELIGYHIYIKLVQEKKSLIKEKYKYIDNLICYFNNNIFQGSAINIYYFIVFKILRTNLFKLIIVNYTFYFNSENIFRSVDNDNTTEKYCINNEIKKKFSTKYSFTYIINTEEESNKNSNNNALKNIIVKQNNNGSLIIIGINFQNEHCNTLILFMTQSYKFNSRKVSKIFPVKHLKLTIEDLAFINNDYFIMVQFINGYFALVNTNFQVIKFFDPSNSFSFFEKTDNIYIFNSILSMNLCNKSNENTEKKYKLITNANKIISYDDAKGSDILGKREKYKRYYEYIIVYTNTNILGFQVGNLGISHIDGLLNNEIKDFEDIIYLLQFIQINEFDENKKSFLFDKVHNYLVINFGQIFQSLKAIINPLFTEQDLEQYQMNSEVSANDTFQIQIFIKFVKIFRNLNLTNYSPISLVSYFMILTTDFFSYLINQNEVWFAFLLVELSEKYLLYKLKFRNYKNNSNDAKYLQGKTSFLIFNPNFLQSSSVKGYNRINNSLIYSKLRLIIVFYCLMEFRNNQAKNINVLYFVLAKLVVDKLKEDNLLNDLNLMIKVVIRNWKYLKSENMKSGCEEYILNSFSMNQKADTLALLLHSNNFITSNYIGRKTLPKSMGNSDNVTSTRNTKSRFDFFNDFYSLDELNNFNNFIISSLSGKDNKLSREYNYFNHMGIVQKWLTYFINYLYPELFKDFKYYINAHLKQTIENNMQKKPENISQDEKNLYKMIYFNLYSFMNVLVQFNKEVFEYFLNYNPDEKSKLFSIALPHDMPYLTSEFYAIIYNMIEKNLVNRNENDTSNKQLIFLKDINNVYCLLLERYKKQIDFNINNVFDFCNFLIQKGFKYYLNNVQIDNIINNNTNESDNNNDISNNIIIHYIFALLEFNVIVIHKNNLFSEIDLKEDEECFILKAIKLFPDNLKKNIYELCLLIFTGYIRYYIYIQIGGGKNVPLKPQEEYNFKLCVNFLHNIYHNYINENPSVIENVNEFVQITPDFIKLQLIDEGLENLINIFYNDFGENILDTNKILNEKYFIEINDDENKLFINNRKINYNFYCNVFSEDINKYNEFNNSFCAMIDLIFNGNKNFEFDLLSDNNQLLNIMKTDVNELFFDKIIHGKIDDFKNLYKDSEFTAKMITKIKINIIKFLHLFTILFIKYKLLKLNLKKNQLEILELYVILLLLVENSKNFSLKVEKICHCLKVVISNGINSANENKTIVDILININLGFIFKHLEPNDQFKNLEKLIGEKYKNLMDLYSNTISNNINIFSKLQGKFKDQNKSTLFFLNSFYNKILNETFHLLSNQAKTYVNNKDNISHFIQQREIYKILLEKYYILTGFNVNMDINFEEDWDLTINSPIYNLIVSDKFQGRKFFNKSLFELMVSDSTKTEAIQLPNLSVQDENIINNEIENIESNEINENDEIKFYKIAFKNKKEKRKKNLIESKKGKYNNYEIFGLVIKKIIFYRFINQVFMCFKKRSEVIDLEKLEFIKLNMQNKTTESFIVKEKYVSFNDCYHKEDYYNDLSQLRKLNVVKINKFMPGNSNNSQLFNELLQKKETSHLANKIQEKLQEIQNKLKQFEEFNELVNKKLTPNKEK